MNILTQLTQEKGIRIKINSHMERLVNRSKENVSEVQAALRKYQTESMALCGKTYEYLWTNLVISRWWSRPSWNWQR